MKSFAWFWTLSVGMVLVGGSLASAGPPVVALQPGDHICIVGNGLGERMQHYGWLETYLHAQFPKHHLVVRNLAYVGDECDGFKDGNKRMRSMSFGTQDEWLSGQAPCPQPNKLEQAAVFAENRFHLTQTNADVILAFYGYNEAQDGGPEGLARFRERLGEFIKHTMAQKYNGKSAPRLVLISPTAHEDLHDPNLPDGVESNGKLRLYTQAMAEVAKAHGVGFVDVFTPTRTHFASRPAGQACTINGIHLNERGDQFVAELIARAIAGGSLAASKPEGLEPLRQAVNDKAWHWFHRYRVTDGYSVYGDRAFLKFTDGNPKPGELFRSGQANYEVGQRELEILDVKTSNRDKRIWQVAEDVAPTGAGATRAPSSKLPPVDDSNIPRPLEVRTNKPGTLPDGKHAFLSGKDAISKMTVHNGLSVNLFASEEMFPEMVNPVQMAFDPRGRLWIATWPMYPHWNSVEPMSDKLVILEDTNGDGQADRCKTFAGDLHNPTGFEFWNGGVLVAQGPDLWFLKDTNGDDVCDFRERVVHGFDTADTHHTINSFALDPGGALYMQEGTFHHSQIETPWGAPQRVANGGVFRFEPRTFKTDVYVSYGFANPHGHAFDHWGQDIVVDGTGAVPYHAALFSSHLPYPNKHGGTPTVYQQRTRPCSGIEYLSSQHFPESMRDNLLVCNVIGFQGILRYKVDRNRSSFGAEEQEPILFSSDPNFRPSDLEMGPDGALYFADWQNPIIGHMQHNLRDPSRDRDHGRVYRVTVAGKPVLTPTPIAGQPVAALVGVLASDADDRVRYRARIELSARSTNEVIAAAKNLAAQASATSPGPARDHQLLEALWLHQQHNVVDAALLSRVLKCEEPRARAAAMRVLCYWRDRVANGLDLVKHSAADPDPLVRLEALRTASFYPSIAAAEVPLIVSEQPTDPYLDHLLREVNRTLQPFVDQYRQKNQRPPFTTEAGIRYVLRNLSTEELLKEPRTRPVLQEMLFRPGLLDDQRREAVRGLAKLDKQPEITVVMQAIRSLDQRSGATDIALVFDLVRQLTARDSLELTTARAELEQLAQSAKQPLFRQIGFVSLMLVDGSADPAWQLANQSVRSLQDFVNALPLVADTGLRAGLYERIEPLLHQLPPQFAAAGRGTLGRYIRIELPGSRRVLTLAEVEVYSGGTNVARRGKASQKNTSHGGEAARAIDGNLNPSYGGNGQTHTDETDNPWWEVDLQEEFPIEKLVIHNRADGLSERLQGYSLIVLDQSRNVVHRQDKLPAPTTVAEFTLSEGGAESTIRRAAMNALTYVRGQETKTFQILSKFVLDDVDRVAAIRALQRLPQATWPKDDPTPMLNVLSAAVRKMPAADRTSPAALDALEFADALTSLLPADSAKRVRAELGELGVRVIKLGTVFEKMSYDKETLVVRAGKPVEFLLENSDLMPHNFVIVQPGALEEIGLQAEASAQQPGFAEKQYVPDSGKVLAKSQLMPPRSSQRLSFQVPDQPGVYPYVCTYPGHWRRMYGALYVVADLDEYRANPEAYLTANKIAPADALLNDRRPRTEWKLEDLASVVATIGAPPTADHQHAAPSFGSGKELFKVANCIACHKVDGAGNNFGPDLTKLDPKWQPVDILKEILDPSAKINEKYQTEVFELTSGKVITGLVVESTAESLSVIENPLANAKPVVIPVKEIAERVKSKVSIMPKGLLDKLTREEILELIAFVNARGDKQHAVYQSKGGHGH